MRAAFLDLGTNTIILLIVEIHVDGSHVVLHDEMRVVRLGEGIHKNAFFLAEAMDRAYLILAEFKDKIGSFSCEKIIAVGTAGFRNATNAEDFIARVQKGLGLEIQIISGEKEADLIHLAVLADFCDLPLPRVVLDIGGGSTEFIIEEDDRPVRAMSLPFGSVKLTENFIATDPPIVEELTNLRAFLKSQLTTLSLVEGEVTLIATAGTATTLAALAQNLKAYDADKVHGSILNVSRLYELSERLAKTPLAERQKWPCLEPRRADIIVAGTEILKAVAEYFRVSHIIVSDRGLRYGLLAENKSAFLTRH